MKELKSCIDLNPHSYRRNSGALCQIRVTVDRVAEVHFIIFGHNGRHSSNNTLLSYFKLELSLCRKPQMHKSQHNTKTDDKQAEQLI